MNQSLRSTVHAVKRPLLLFVWAVALTVLFSKIAPGCVLHTFSGVLGVHHAIGESIRREGFAVAVAVLGYLQEVRNAIEDETQILVTERNAFEQFADTVESMEVTTSTMTAESVLRSEKLADSTQLERIQDHYRETVMSVPHYDEDYGEDLFEHMSEELSPEAAIAVVDGSGFAPQLRELLVVQARIAARSREELIETIDAENQSVRSAIASLRDTESILNETKDNSLQKRSFSELMEAERDLSWTMNALDETIRDRQADIQRVERRSPAVERSTFHRYLYRGLKPTFPVLDALLDRYETLRDRRRAVIRRLARW